MLSWIAKFLLGATALAPMLGAVAVNQFAHGLPRTYWLPWLVAGLGLVVICWLLLVLASKHGEQHAFAIKEFEDKDKEVVTFLLTYLLPFLATDKLEFTGEWLTGAYILAVIVVTVVHAGAFHFNPVMGLFYHFYSVKDGNGASNLLITRNPVRRVGHEINTVRISEGIYLERG